MFDGIGKIPVKTVLKTAAESDLMFIAHIIGLIS